MLVRNKFWPLIVVMFTLDFPSCFNGHQNDQWNRSKKRKSSPENQTTTVCLNCIELNLNLKTDYVNYADNANIMQSKASASASCKINTIFVMNRLTCVRRGHSFKVVLILVKLIKYYIFLTESMVSTKQ